MVLVDLPLAQLREYRCPRPAPTGHREFWDRTLAESRAAAVGPGAGRVRPPGVRGPAPGGGPGGGGEPRCEPVASGLAVVDSYDVTFSGFGGEEVRGWWLLPRGASSPLPVVVEYLGYGGGRGLVHERLTWAAHGFAQLVVDSRGQGGVWNTGDT